MEFMDRNRTCRLCLNICNGHFEILNEIVQSNLNSLLLYPDLTISDEPITCEACSENLQHCLVFKAKCLITEDRISKCRHDNFKMDLREIFQNEINDSSSSDYNLCRFCLEVVNFSLVDCFVGLENTDIEKLGKYFPELDFNIIKQPVACTSCYKSVQRNFGFIENCLETEAKIIDYCKVEGTNNKGQVDLNNIAKFEPKNTLRAKDRLCEIKVEEIRMEDAENLKISDEVKPTHLVEIKQEFVEPLEDVETKAEDIDYNSSAEATPTTQRPYRCEFCQYTTDRRYNLKQHLLSHKSLSEVTSYKCDECAFVTKYKSYIRSHRLMHKSADEMTMIRCDICEYQTKTKAYLREHIIVKHGTATRKCTKCDFETKHQSSLRAHMITHKSSSEVTMHRCPECSFETKYKSNISKHMVKHKEASEVNLYLCDVCAFRTRRKNSFRLHSLVHKSASEIELIKCEQCSYQTKRKDNLQQHMKIHKSLDEVVSFKCELCSYQSKRKENLQSHMLMHKDNSEVTLFKCTLCAFQTKYKRSFQRHMNLHGVESVRMPC